MDTSVHNMSTLFLQLGLNNSPQGIYQFINEHKGLNSQTSLQDANFWNTSQASFIQEAIAYDSDWAEVVDQLDSLLR